jgi:serine/threonine-protein kinase
MVPDRSELIAQLFNAARQRDEAERAAFLTTACGSDIALRHEIESLLDRDGDSGPVPTAANTGTVAVANAVASTDRLGFPPGTVIGRRYRIVSALGRGGMGEVYRADDLKLGQRVALKFLSPEFANDVGRMRHLVNEVRLARKISHPNVCRVYDIGEADGRHYLSMEYIDGEDLASLLKRIGRLPPEKVLEIARQLCAGLAAAHEQGVLHRDLKPANIMIDSRGRARIADFGLAVMARSRTAGQIAGTPAYMAPEQVAGRLLTAKTDIFALGLILYELLTGARAFHGVTLEQRYHADRDAEAVARSADIDPSIKNVIVRCLKQDPAARPASVTVLASSLPGGADPLLAALAAGEIPSPEMVAAAGNARRIRPIAAGVCLGLAIVGLLVAVWQLRPMMVYRQVALTKSPDALAERARQIVTRLGYTEEPVDTAYWFAMPQTSEEMASHRSALYEVPSRAPRGSGIFFVYRQSARVLVPENALGVIQYREPPADVPGMADVTLDSAGRLLRFSAVPGARRSATPPAPDWAATFSAAGLDYRTFESRETQWRPRVAHDVVAAWEGPVANRPTERISITAAAWDGRPVVFDTTGGSRSAATEAPIGPGDPLSDLAFLIMTLAALVAAGVLARWNIRQGRWDRSGALKVAAYISIMGVLLGLLRADHVSNGHDEYLIFVRIVSWNLYFGGFAFLIYVAFEPFVRERWPAVLTSWNRALSARFRDPLVGQEILIGALAGVAVVIIREAEFIVSPWLGLAIPDPLTSPMDGLGSWRQFASLAAFTHVEALSLALAWLLMLLLLRIVLRHDRLAIAAAVLIALPVAIIPGGNLLLEAVLGLIVSSLSVFVMLRFGLLASVVEISVTDALVRLPITFNFTEWYAGRSVVVLACVMSLVVYGFNASLGGHRMFGRGLVWTR